MTAPERLSDEEIALVARTFPAWEVGPDAMRRTFVFADFATAMGFVVQAALIAERQNHHPTWTNTYRTVAVELSTHDAGGLTQRDAALAAELDRIAARLGAAA